MRFHTFGSSENKIMILIHGVLTPWQIWQEQIDYFSEKCFVIVPALDGHIEEEASEFKSVSDEADKIARYVMENYGKDVDTVCGLSMGGVIAYKIFEGGRLNIKNLVIDGGPLVPVPKLSVWFMEKSYLSIIHKCKVRDRKTLESFKKDFLPEKYLDSFLKFADTMSDETIKNMVNSIFGTTLKKIPDREHINILYLHGTKANEVISGKAAKKMKELYPQTEIKCFEGFLHAELAIYHGGDWIKEVDGFLCRHYTV